MNAIFSLKHFTEPVSDFYDSLDMQVDVLRLLVYMWSQKCVFVVPVCHAVKREYDELPALLRFWFAG